MERVKAQTISVLYLNQLQVTGSYRELFGECPWNTFIVVSGSVGLLVLKPLAVFLALARLVHVILSTIQNGFWLVLLCHRVCASADSEGRYSVGDELVLHWTIRVIWLPSVLAQWHSLFPPPDWLICYGSAFVSLEKTPKQKNRTVELIHTTVSGADSCLIYEGDISNWYSEHPDFLPPHMGTIPFACHFCPITFKGLCDTDDAVFR